MARNSIIQRKMWVSEGSGVMKMVVPPNCVVSEDDCLMYPPEHRSSLGDHSLRRLWTEWIHFCGRFHLYRSLHFGPMGGANLGRLQTLLFAGLHPENFREHLKSAVASLNSLQVCVVVLFSGQRQTHTFINVHNYTHITTHTYRYMHIDTNE